MSTIYTVEYKDFNENIVVKTAKIVKHGMEDGSILFRNVENNRLFYIEEWRILNLCKQKLDISEAWA